MFGRVLNGAPFNFGSGIPTHKNTCWKSKFSYRLKFRVWTLNEEHFDTSLVQLKDFEAWNSQNPVWWIPGPLPLPRYPGAAHLPSIGVGIRLN